MRLLKALKGHIMDEIIIEGFDHKTGDYEGKPYEHYIIYGMINEKCEYFGNPHKEYVFPGKYLQNILKGHSATELKGKKAQVAYDKYRKPAYLIIEWL